MNRVQFQQLAEIRVRDAEVLLNAGQWSGAYYLTGYAVECGLKACIAKLTLPHDYPDKEFAQKCYTHNIEALVELGGLTSQRKADAIAKPTLGNNWIIAKDWNEKARYQQWTEPEARDLFAAITDTIDGVLPWIKLYW
jgi:HEPN domain-containing protein